MENREDFILKTTTKTKQNKIENSNFHISKNGNREKKVNSTTFVPMKVVNTRDRSINIVLSIEEQMQAKQPFVLAAAACSSSSSSWHNTFHPLCAHSYLSFGWQEHKLDRLTFIAECLEEDLVFRMGNNNTGAEHFELKFRANSMQCRRT